MNITPAHPIAPSKWPRPRNLFDHAKRFALRNKTWSAVIAIAVLIGGWQAYARLTSGPSMPSYVLAQAQTGTLVVSVTGTGQVSASNLLSITPQVSGKITYLGVKDGTTVKAGDLIAEIDPTAAQEQVTSAQSSLKSAQLSLEKLTEPADALSLAQANGSLAAAQDSLTTAYSNATADLASTFLDLPAIMSSLEDIDFGTETNHTSQWNIDFYENSAAKYDASDAQIYRDKAYNDYQTAKASYDKTFNDYKAVNLAAAGATTTEQLLSETYDTVQSVMNAVKSSNALIQFYSDQLTANNLVTPSIAATQINSLASYTSKLSTHSSALLGDTTSISTDKQTVTEQNLSLQNLKNGPDPIDVQTSQLAVQNAQDVLQNAKHTLSEYYITAPFGGTLALNATRYEQVGPSDTIATMVTPDKIAEITLNEIDAAKVKVGDKATLTFDAVPDLTIAGTVADISPLGTVSQGVVSYTVKIDFATQDPRIKAGMSVSASIDTDVEQNVLIVPSSAVHAGTGGASYVLVFNPPLRNQNGAQSVSTAQTPEQVPVTTGVSNDTLTAIASGLKDGQQVIARTENPSTASSGSAAPSILGGGRGPGAGAARGAGFLQRG